MKKDFMSINLGKNYWFGEVFVEELNGHHETFEAQFIKLSISGEMPIEAESHQDSWFLLLFKEKTWSSLSPIRCIWRLTLTWSPTSAIFIFDKICILNQSKNKNKIQGSFSVPLPHIPTTSQPQTSFKLDEIGLLLMEKPQPLGTSTSKFLWAAQTDKYGTLWFPPPP